MQNVPNCDLAVIIPWTNCDRNFFASCPMDLIFSQQRLRFCMKNNVISDCDLTDYSSHYLNLFTAAIFYSGLAQKNISWYFWLGFGKSASIILISNLAKIHKNRRNRSAALISLPWFWALTVRWWHQENKGLCFAHSSFLSEKYENY